MKTIAQTLADQRESDTLPNLYPVAVRNDVELVDHRAVPAAALKPGDRVDLEEDEYADPEHFFKDPEPEHSSEFAYEFAVVESVVFETPGCVLVHTSQGSFGFPPGHTLPVEVCDTCEGRGYFTNPGPNDGAILVTRCDRCERFDGDEDAGRHAAKLRGWSVLASAWMSEPVGGRYLASLEEGSVLASDGEAPAFAWIADTMRHDDSVVADGYMDSPYVVEFRLERLPLETGPCVACDRTRPGARTPEGTFTCVDCRGRSPYTEWAKP